MALQLETEPDRVASGLQGRGRAALVPLIFFLIGIWLCLESFQVPFGSFRMPGAGFFPLLLGLTLSGLSIVLLAMTLLGASARLTQVWPERLDLFYLAGAILASAWLFERAGFLLTMALFLTVVMKALGQMGWATAVILALIGSVVSYFLFGRLLLIALPSGILPF